MSDKELRDKAIDIKGKKYVPVAERVLFFNDEWPYGAITTEMLSSPEAETVVIKATVTPDQKRFFTGHSQATWGDGYINKTSALENAETSAVGRALAMMGIGVIESIASSDEINKAETAKFRGGFSDESRLADKIDGQERIAAFQVAELEKRWKASGWSAIQVATYLSDLNNYVQLEEIQKQHFNDAIKAFSKAPGVPVDMTPVLQRSVEVANASKGTCEACGGKVVPAGVSKKTNKSYPAFCSNPDCSTRKKQKVVREPEPEFAAVDSDVPF